MSNPITISEQKFVSAIIIENDKDIISLINTYARPQRLLSSTFRKREHPEKSKGRNPAGGDFNAHSQSWRYGDTDNKGNKLIDFLLLNSHFVQNH